MFHAHRKPPAQYDITFDLEGVITEVARVTRSGETEAVALDGDITFATAGAYVVASGEESYRVLMLDEETGFWVAVAHDAGAPDLEAIALEIYTLLEPGEDHGSRAPVLEFTIDAEGTEVIGVARVLRDGTTVALELDEDKIYTVSGDYVVITKVEDDEDHWAIFALDADSGTHVFAARGEGALDLEALDEVVEAYEPDHGHGRPFPPKIYAFTLNDEETEVIGTARLQRDGTLEEDEIEETESYQLVDGYVVETDSSGDEDHWTIFVLDEETGYYVAADRGEGALDLETLDDLVGDFVPGDLGGPERDYHGGAGHDHFRGGRGDDRMSGGSGRDHLEGGEGRDLLRGDTGRDHLDGGAGRDKLRGGGGDDTIEGGRGGDRLFGDRGNDDMLGEGGRDRMFGGTGEDVLRGGGGNDALDGGDDDDLLLGGSGDDTLNGGGGDDVLRGHSGADTFVFDTDGGADVVVDFYDGEDMLSFTAAGAFEDLTIAAQGNHTLIDYGSGTALLRHVDVDLIDAGDFLFA